MDVPAFDNSAMDGYALCVANFNVLPASFDVVQRIAAGHTGVALAPNTAARIFTGAPIPQGCNAIVPQEHTQTSGTQVKLLQSIETSQHIRLRGEDIAQGSVVLQAGTPLGPQHLAMIASIGVPMVDVYAPIKVGVFFTGDELTEPGKPLQPGAIYNSNRFAIVNLLKKIGCSVIDYGIVRDSAQETQAALKHAANENDLVITCGGVSVGEEDHVKAAVMALGKLDLWQISMKPGKPLAYGKVGNSDFIGLPGNPVSAFVTFLLMARPFLAKRMGLTDYDLKYTQAQADFDWPRPDKRREFLRVRRATDATGKTVLGLWPNQGSGVMSSVAWADGLVDVPPESVIKKGDSVRYLSLSDLLS
jgi:molybdopterin molybdotransferase